MSGTLEAPKWDQVPLKSILDSYTYILETNWIVFGLEYAEEKANCTCEQTEQGTALLRETCRGSVHWLSEDLHSICQR